jgi:transposase InsO family protein
VHAELTSAKTRPSGTAPSTPPSRERSAAPSWKPGRGGSLAGQLSACRPAVLVTSALDMAIRSRDAHPGMVIRSDHGTQYNSWVFTDRGRASGLVASMGSIGDCCDNTMIESFWGRMQAELLNRKRGNPGSSSPTRSSGTSEIFHNHGGATQPSACSPRSSRNFATTTSGP